MAIIFQDDFSSGNYILKDGQISPNKLWKSFYNGYGTIECKNGVMNMKPRPVTSKDKTSACLLMTEKTFKDFELTCNMKTVSHTRQGSPPKNWEVAWIFFRYNDKLPNGQPDKHHHFYFHPSINSMLEIGKKDYVAIPGGLQTPDGVNHTCDQEQQQYLMTKDNAVPFALGKSYKIKLVVVGRNIKLWIDDKQIADVTDDGTIGYDSASDKKPIGYPASETMLSGKIGLYCEDSYVQFDNVVVSDTVTTSTPTPEPPTTTVPEPVAIGQVYLAISKTTAEQQKIFKTEKGCDDYITNHSNAFVKTIAPFFP